MTADQPAPSSQGAPAQPGMIFTHSTVGQPWTMPSLIGGRFQGCEITDVVRDVQRNISTLHLDDGRTVVLSDLQLIQMYQTMNAGTWTQANVGWDLPPMTLKIRTPKEESLLAKILRWYHASMAGDVRSPLLHLVGPPGCGKSTTVEQAAQILGVNLHIINVSRINPLEVEGVQMPTDQNTKLAMLTATWWSQLEEGDIVLLDEFLRGFAEVYNALLDVLTARRVGAFPLPKVFFIAASNSVATYDPALSDRLLHKPVDDPRSVPAERLRIANTIVDALGLLPSMAKHAHMDALLHAEVLPMYALLDQFDGTANATASRIKGRSPRNLIGQVKLREVDTPTLKALIEQNNYESMREQKYQHVVLLDGKDPDPTYVARARKLVGNAKLTEIQAQNLDLNLQLVEMQEALTENAEEITEVDFDDPLS